MRFVVLAVAVVVSLWPAAVIAVAVERVLGGGDDDTAPALTVARTAAEPAATTPAQANPEASPRETQPSPATAPVPAGQLDLEGLNRLRDDTADLVVAVEDSAAASGLPDAQLAADALDVEAEIVRWQEANEGLGADAEYFAELFAEIAAATADFSTAPGPAAKDRLDEAIARHRRETLQAGK